MSRRKSLVTEIKDFLKYISRQNMVLPETQDEALELLARIRAYETAKEID